MQDSRFYGDGGGEHASGGQWIRGQGITWTGNHVDVGQFKAIEVSFSKWLQK